MSAKTIFDIFRGLTLITVTAFVITLFLPLALFYLFLNWLENEARGEVK